MKVLIIGLGSIAKKHIKAIRKFRPNSEIWALRSHENAAKIKNIYNIFSWQEVPDDLDFILISNPTSEHFQTINKALKYRVPLFIEKPPLMSLEGAEKLLELVKKEKIRTYTAFNFRFHPVLIWLKDILKEKNVLEVQAYCGSYLPDWRPGQDYRNNYSAKKKMGGGVHLDLIHEMDYICWIFASPLQVSGYQRKVSPLEIDSVDYAHYYLFYNQMSCTITLNYFRRDPKRQIEIVMENESWVVDLLANKVTNSKGEVIFQSNEPVSATYSSQMRYFIETLESGQGFNNDLTESVQTLQYALA